MENLDAPLPSPGTQRAASRIPLHGVCRRVPVGKSPQAAVGQALGGGDHHRGHHTQGSTRGQAPRLVSKVKKHVTIAHGKLECQVANPLKYAGRWSATFDSGPSYEIGSRSEPHPNFPRT